MTVILAMGGGGRGKAPWSSLRMTQLLFYIQSVSISKGGEVPAELFGQLSGPTETSRLWINLLAAGGGHFEYRPLLRGRFMWQPKIKGKAGGSKRSWKLFAGNFDVWTVAENTLNSTRYANWPCKTCNCAFFEAPKGDFNNNSGWITRINGMINSDAKRVKGKEFRSKKSTKLLPKLIVHLDAARWRKWVYLCIYTR